MRDMKTMSPAAHWLGFSDFSPHTFDTCAISRGTVRTRFGVAGLAGDGVVVSAHLFMPVASGTSVCVGIAASEVLDDEEDKEEPADGTWMSFGLMRSSAWTARGVGVAAAADTAARES